MSLGMDTIHSSIQAFHSHDKEIWSYIVNNMMVFVIILRWASVDHVSGNVLKKTGEGYVMSVIGTPRYHYILELAK